MVSQREWFIQQEWERFGCKLVIINNLENGISKPNLSIDLSDWCRYHIDTLSERNLHFLCLICLWLFCNISLKFIRKNWVPDYKDTPVFALFLTQEIIANCCCIHYQSWKTETNICMHYISLTSVVSWFPHIYKQQWNFLWECSYNISTYIWER